MTVQVQSTMDKEQIYERINVDPDARRYFFHKADERWLDWLWRNGFLSAIKEENAAPFATRTPELEYLLRMAEKRPDSVVDIMLDTPISTDTRSQEVAYGFLRICSSLPADQLARVVGKIRAERWIPLIDAIYRHSAFKCEEMLKTLEEAGDHRSMLILTGAVLTVRSKDEMENMHRYRDNPFYFDYLSRTDIFRRLSGVDIEYAEDAFALATEVIADVVLLGDQEKGREGERVFAVTDRFALSSEDFFDPELGQGRPHSFEAEVRELAAVIKILTDRLIGGKYADSDNARRILEKYRDSLPDSRVTWRLRLYAWSLCPQVFGEELKEAFFRLFDVERYYGITAGAEYQKALRKGFPVLSAEDQRVFVQRTIEKFRQLPDNMNLGSQILSMVLPFLDENPDLEKQARAAGFQLDPEYEPKPAMSDIGESREVIPQAPITQEEFGQLSIAEIARKLRKEWTPEKLNAQNTLDDWYTPLNARGVGDLIKTDMPQRLQQYINGAKQFFDRDLLDPHYTYEYLAGIEKTSRDHRESAAEAKWDGVIDLLEGIGVSGENTPYARGNRKLDDFWLASWDAVHLVATDVLRDLFTEKDGLALIQFGKYRDQILGIINYFLTHPQPSPEDEQDETPRGALDISAREREPEKRWLTDPFSKAIQTVRGRAFETLVLFAESDGPHLRDDVKQVYERMIQKESTRALMSMAGRFLPSFYFRDRDWIRELLPQMFSQEPEKKYLSTAAWEGYLTNGLYRAMFTDAAFQKLYQRSLGLTSDDYPRHQKHVANPDEGIAEHLALAFMYYDEEFGFEHPLFKAFWEKDNPKQHAHFVSFFGQEFVFRSDTHDFFKNHPGGKERLRDFWDWFLKNHERPETFREFGLWINLEKEIFGPAWLAPRVKKTLEKSNGVLYQDDDLMESSVRIAQEAPEDTLEIARLYLLEGGVRGGQRQTLMSWDLDKKWIQAFEILYRNPATKVQTEALINQLVGEGGQAFWSLEQIVANNT